MGLFDKFKKQEKQVERKTTFAENVELSDWFQVFSACLGKVTAIQHACSELVVKNQNWNVDFGKGVIAFGDDEYPLQFIGSEANSDGTWLWGWENLNGFPSELIEMANDTKAMGEKWSLAPLTCAEQAIDDTFNGHCFSIVACGISNNKYCYYRGPHDGGAIFAGFSGVPKQVFSSIDHLKFTSLTMECIQQFHVDHKIFVESLLLWNGTPYEWQGDEIVAHFASDLEIVFEQAGDNMRISTIKTE